MKTNNTLGLVAAAWMAATAGGFSALWAYAANPGDIGKPAYSWPADAYVRRHQRRPTLVLFLHPRCPCSRATLTELNKVMSQAKGRLAARAVFFRPAQAAPGWEKSALWSQAWAIPGVQVLSDRGGRQARLFGAETSGAAILYDASGRVVFRGGLTERRGHEGDNPGSSAILERVLRGAKGQASTAVFGCSLWRRAS